MAELLAPTTELEALNRMLGAISQSPVDSLDVTDAVDASNALFLLRSVSREIQSKGWHWNTEVDYPITLTDTSELRLPTNCVRVDTVRGSANTDVAQRGLRLYDRTNHRYTFTDGVTVDMVVLLPFDELPEPVRHYIMVRAMRMFVTEATNGDSLTGYSEKDEIVAFAALNNFEAQTQDANILNGSWSVGRILNRQF